MMDVAADGTVFVTRPDVGDIVACAQDGALLVSDDASGAQRRPRGPRPPGGMKIAVPTRARRFVRRADR